MRKVAIITEFLNNCGGIEKSIIELTKELTKRSIQYDIYCGLYEPDKTFSDFKTMNIKCFMSKKLPSGVHALYLRYKFSKLKLSGYDGYIFFGFHSIAAAKNNKPNVMWSQGPLAYLYLNDDAGVKNGPKKIIADIFRKILKNIDQKNIKEVGSLLSLGNLSNIKLKNVYPNVRNEILHQPIDIDKYTICNKGEYYLSLARLNKNVDKVVLAFQKMPTKQLYVYGSGSEEEKNKINNLANGYTNIHILGFAEEKDLPSIYGNSIAVIAINPDEDFTMNLMEGLASGKPGISINPRKSYENLIITDTGILIKDSSTENICRAVSLMTSEKAIQMKIRCKEKAKTFSTKNYVDVILSKFVTKE